MIINLLRDLVHTNPDSIDTTWGGPRVRGANTVEMNNTGIVHQTSGSCQNQYERLDDSLGEWYATGLLISQPIVDATPYRLKVFLGIGGASGNENDHRYAFMGYAPANPTGTNDVIEKCSMLPIGPRGIVDEIILAPGLPEGDPYFDRPLAFGVAAIVAANSTRYSHYISVQNLSKTAPQFAASMS